MFKVTIILVVITTAIFFVGIGLGLLQDYRKTKETEYLFYGVAFEFAAFLFLYLFFHIIKF